MPQFLVRKSYHRRFCKSVRFYSKMGRNTKQKKLKLLNSVLVDRLLAVEKEKESLKVEKELQKVEIDSLKMEKHSLKMENNLLKNQNSLLTVQLSANAPLQIPFGLYGEQTSAMQPH